MQLGQNLAAVAVKTDEEAVFFLKRVIVINLCFHVFFQVYCQIITINFLCHIQLQL